MATTFPPESALPEVAEGVYRLGTKWINFYLAAEEGEFTLVDAGSPGYWKYLEAAVDALGTNLGAIRAVVVTHEVRGFTKAAPGGGAGSASSPIARLPEGPGTGRRCGPLRTRDRGLMGSAGRSQPPAKSRTTDRG